MLSASTLEIVSSLQTADLLLKAVIILGQTLLKLHAGINGIRKDKEGLLSRPHFLNTLQQKQNKNKDVFFIFPRGVSVLFMQCEYFIFTRKQGNYQHIRSVRNK